MGFSGQEYWNGLPFSIPGDILDPGIEPRSPALQADSLPTDPIGNSLFTMSCWFQMHSTMIQLYIHKYILLFRFIFLIDYYKLLKTVLCYTKCPCGLAHLCTVVSVYANSKLLSFPSPSPPFPFGNHNFVFVVCGFISVL